MFSASLLSMMVHSLPPPAQGAFQGPPASERPGGAGQSIIPNASDLEGRFRRALVPLPTPWPRIPVIARADEGRFSTLALLAKNSGGPEDRSRGFVWGRFPLDLLIGHYLTFGAANVDEEHLDLGTPVQAVSGGGGGPTSTCATLLTQTPAPANATVGAAIVDSGDAASPQATPQHFGSKLRHAGSPSGVDLSQHAEQVLEVLLDRLNSHSAPGGAGTMLSITTVSMALMLSPAPNQVHGSLDCFHQHCAPELLTAVQTIYGHLNADGIPAVVNISLGTHVGPHNGESPLEAYLATTLFRPNDRFIFAAAGNEGDKGISARLDLTKGEADFMTVVVDAQCTELLIEFWWDDSVGADLEIVAEITGSGMRPSRVPINPNVQGIATTLQPSSTGQRPPVTFLSLFHSQAHGSMSCITFAATRTTPTPDFTVAFDITAKSADVAVHAWIVIADPAIKTHFTSGIHEGTVAVPASDPKVVSVAGYDASRGQMWRDSSRGPSSRYLSTTQSPAMAHLVSHPGSGGAPPGTSFASPRAAADAAVALADTVRRANCNEVDNLITETYGAIGTWDPRHGFRKQTT